MQMRANTITTICAACLCVPLLAQDPPAAGTALYQFQIAEPLAEPRAGACLASLGGGKVLAAGGWIDGVPSSVVEVHSADLGWSRAAPLSVARGEHTCTALADGRVMVAGGRGAAGSVGAIEIYDPSLDEWRRLPQSMIGRWRHSATLLTDGRVLLAGGQNDTRFFDTLEIVDPWFNTLTLLNSRLRSPRTGHATAALPGGAALVAGGLNTTGFIAPLDLVRPSGQVEAGPVLPEGAAGLSATPLLDGKVLLAGGTDAFGDTDRSSIYDPQQNSLTSAPPLPGPRTGHRSLLLEGNGRVLVFGGSAGEAPVVATVLFDSASGSWESGPDLPASSPSSAAVASAGRLLALADSMLTLKYPALQLERAVILPGMTVRAAFVGIQDAAEAVVRATAVGSSLEAVLERTLPASPDLADLFSPGPETSGKRWIVSAAMPGVPVLQSVFAQKARVQILFDVRPGSPQAYESTALGFTLSREGENPEMTWPPAIALRVRGRTDSNSASGFILEVPAGQSGPARLLAGGEYEISARLSSLHDLYEIEPAVPSRSLTVVRRTPQALDYFLPGGATIVGEVRSITAGVRTGLPATIPGPSGAIAFSRGGFTIGEIRLPGGGSGRGTVNTSMGKAGALPFEFKYSGDHNYAPVSATSPPYTVQKGNLSLALKPLKDRYGVGENATIDAVLTHPKVPGATPTGRIEPMTNPRGLVGAGAAVGGDPANTGSITVRVHAGTATATLSNAAVGFNYSGDENFNPRSATTVVDFARTWPTLVFTPPATAAVGQTISFEVTVKASAALANSRPAVGSVQLISGGVFQRGFTLLPKGGDAATVVTVGPHPAPGAYEYLFRYLGDTAYEEVDSPTFRIVVQ